MKALGIGPTSSMSTSSRASPARCEPVRLRDPLRGRPERGREVGGAEQHPRQLRRQTGLPAGADRLLRAPPRDHGEARGDGRGEQEHDERDEVLAVGDREAARGRDVEEVERQRADDARRDAARNASDDRDEQHRGQVDDSERDGLRDLPERVEQQRL